MISAHPGGGAEHTSHLMFALFCVLVVVGCIAVARLSAPRGRVQSVASPSAPDEEATARAALPDGRESWPSVLRRSPGANP